MKNSFSIIVLLFSIFCLGQQQATVEFRSLEEAISYGLNKNLTIVSNELELEKAAIEVKLARSNRMPQISGTFTGQKNLELATTLVPGELFGQPGETVATQFGQEYQYNAGININNLPNANQVSFLSA